MKRLGIAICASIVLIYVSMTSAHAQSDQIILEANESAPYWSQSLPLDGMAGQIVHAISAAAGLTSVIKYKPLKRLIEDDSNNDLGNPAFYMRNQDFESIVPIAVYYVSVFYYKPRFKKPLNITGIKDLKGYKVGVLKGTVVNKAAFERAGLHLEESYSQASLFKKLQRGRIDICVEIDLVGRHVIKHTFPDNTADFAEFKLTRSVSPIAIMIANNSDNPPGLGERYRKGLAAIINSGKYNEIIEDYYGKNFMPKNWHQQLRRFQKLYHFNPIDIDQ